MVIVLLRSSVSTDASTVALLHRGKLHFLTPERLHALYPRADDFIALRRELDPAGVLLNNHLRPLFACGEPRVDACWSRAAYCERRRRSALRRRNSFTSFHTSCPTAITGPTSASLYTRRRTGVTWSAKPRGGSQPNVSGMSRYGTALKKFQV